MCAVITHNPMKKKRSLYINKLLSYSQLYLFHRHHFVRHLEICNLICVKLLQLMCAVITNNSVKNSNSNSSVKVVVVVIVVDDDVSDDVYFQVAFFIPASRRVVAVDLSDVLDHRRRSHAVSGPSSLSSVSGSEALRRWIGVDRAERIICEQSPSRRCRRSRLRRAGRLFGRIARRARRSEDGRRRNRHHRRSDDAGPARLVTDLDGGGGGDGWSLLTRQAAAASGRSCRSCR